MWILFTFGDKNFITIPKIMDLGVTEIKVSGLIKKDNFTTLRIDIKSDIIEIFLFIEIWKYLIFCKFFVSVLMFVMRYTS